MLLRLFFFLWFYWCIIRLALLTEAQAGLQYTFAASWCFKWMYCCFGFTLIVNVKLIRKAHRTKTEKEKNTLCCQPQISEIESWLYGWGCQCWCEGCQNRKWMTEAMRIYFDPVSVSFFSWMRMYNTVLKQNLGFHTEITWHQCGPVGQELWQVD